MERGGPGRAEGWGGRREEKTESTLPQMRLMLVPSTESKYDNEEVKAHLIMKRMEKELFELKSTR